MNPKNGIAILQNKANQQPIKEETLVETVEVVKEIVIEQPSVKVKKDDTLERVLIIAAIVGFLLGLTYYCYAVA